MCKLRAIRKKDCKASLKLVCCQEIHLVYKNCMFSRFLRIDLLDTARRSSVNTSLAATICTTYAPFIF